MSKLKFSLERALKESALGYSAMSEKHPRYKILMRRFKRDLLAMDYEKDLKKDLKKKKKKLKEALEAYNKTTK